jgi:hypothetical protein
MLLTKVYGDEDDDSYQQLREVSNCSDSGLPTMKRMLESPI